MVEGESLANMRTCYDCASRQSCSKKDAAMSAFDAAWAMGGRCPKGVHLVLAVVCEDAVPQAGYRRRSPDWKWGHDERPTEHDRVDGGGEEVCRPA